MVLFEFTTEKSVRSWHTENDVVMGGVSQSQITYENAEQKGAAKFSGNVSLENRGRLRTNLIRRDAFDLTGFEASSFTSKGRPNL